MDLGAPDIHSYARPAEVRVTHIALDLYADFAAKSLRGHAKLDFERYDPKADLILDSKDLRISRVTGGDGKSRSWSLGRRDPILGSALRISLAPGDRQVQVAYETSPQAEALQWLSPAQTDGGVKPFLFTQGQAILTRSWIPLQDSPAVRVSYEARISTPRDLDLVAVMSAETRQVIGDGRFDFAMAKPIPSYLIALAIGDLTHRVISARTAIWAEPGVVEVAASELEDTEDMIQTCEGLFGAYRWGRYDVLVLPPSFPFGGMENPCLTFATPTILAGDKSLVSLIAHELAHSWSGNLVTNATWRDFWLNEGFTVYLEQRIMEALYGPGRAAMETLIGLQGLAEELASLPPGDQRLHIDLTGRNPDDGMTAVPYDKGAAFLRRIEEVFGRQRFDRFLQSYFDRHAFQSITTAKFLEDLDARLLAEDSAKAAQIDIDGWVNQPGLPENCPRPESQAFALVEAAVQTWHSGSALSELNTTPWVTQQWLHFLGELGPDLDLDQMSELDAAFQFTESGNSEILSVWLKLAITKGYRPSEARLERFLMTVGRRKFLKPLYEALAETKAGLQRARDIYRLARPRYHAVTTRTIDAILAESTVL